MHSMGSTNAFDNSHQLCDLRQFDKYHTHYEDTNMKHLQPSALHNYLTNCTYKLQMNIFLIKLNYI